MSKKIKVNGDYEYDLYIGKTGNTKTYTLHYNNSKIWCPHVRNTVAMSLLDNGNGLQFTQNKKGKFDYAELEYFNIITKHIKE